MIPAIADCIAACASTGQTVVATVAAPRRAWEAEVIEHMATWAAEQGPSWSDLEILCDEVLAGETDEDVVLGMISADPVLTEVFERGRNLGWRSRHG